MLIELDGRRVLTIRVRQRASPFSFIGPSAFSHAGHDRPAAAAGRRCCCRTITTITCARSIEELARRPCDRDVAGVGATWRRTASTRATVVELDWWKSSAARRRAVVPRDAGAALSGHATRATPRCGRRG